MSDDKETGNVNIVARAPCVQFGNWGAFKIPIIGAVVTFCAAIAYQDAPVSGLATYTVGATVIAYCHSLAHSTHQNRQVEKADADQPYKRDVPSWWQAVALAAHLVWFGVNFVV